MALEKKEYKISKAQIDTIPEVAETEEVTLVGVKMAESGENYEKVKFSGEVSIGSTRICDVNRYPDKTHTFRANQLNISGNYVAMYENPDTKEMDIYIRVNADSGTFEACSGFPTTDSLYIYQAANGEYVIPSNAVRGEKYPYCFYLKNITFYSIPAPFMLIDEKSTISVDVLQNGSSIASTVTDYIKSTAGTDEPISKEENNIKISCTAHSMGLDDVKAGKTPGTVEVSNLKIYLDLENMLPNGGCLKVSITVGGTTVVYAANESFASTTVQPSTGSITFGVSENGLKTRTISGLTYASQGTTFDITVSNCKNTCWGITNSTKKIQLNTDSIDSSGTTKYEPTSQTHAGYSDNEVSYSNTFTLSKNTALTDSLSIKAWAIDTAGLGQDMKSASCSIVVWDDASTTSDLIESFQDESKRLTSTLASYDSSTDLSSNDGLLVQNGKLMYPNSGVADNNGKSYSGLTGDRTFYRIFKGTDSVLKFASFDIQVGGLTNTFNVNGLSIWAWPCAETESDAYDLMTLFGSSAKGIAQTTPVNGKWSCEWQQSTTKSPTTDGLVIKVTMTAACTTKISKITISNFG